MLSNRSEQNLPIIALNGRKYFRFLDRLYLPSITTSLTKKQIITINRFRERTIRSDSQYLYRSQIHSLFADALSPLGGSAAIEVGPGRFPLKIPEFKRHAAWEIDFAVFQHLQAAEIELINPSSDYDGQFDVCFGVFVFHFDVSVGQLQKLARMLKPNGVFIFNVLTNDAAIKSLAERRLSTLQFRSLSVDLKPFFYKSDTVFICYRSSGVQIARNLCDRVLDLAARSIDRGTA